MKTMEIGSSFDDLWDNSEHLTPERKAKIDLKVELIGKFIEAREEKGI